MPVTFCPATHSAKSFDYTQSHRGLYGSPGGILKGACYEQYKKSDEILQSSFEDTNTREIIPTKNGFVDTVTLAYNQHHALIIRPDDVWLAILSQFSLFVNANAEALRSQFVAHSGKTELVVIAVAPNRYEADFGHMARMMTDRIGDKVIDPSLRTWILPDFTTTTLNDTIVCSIAMMATMKNYFSYTFVLTCGIPRVTLEGEKADWEKILARLDRLHQYGFQTIAWYHLLHPVISRFVKAFDAPDAAENLDFWGRIVHYEGGGSGPTYLSGWITAFCVFGAQGKWLGNQFKKEPKVSLMRNLSEFNSNVPSPASLSRIDFFSTYINTPAEAPGIKPRRTLILDDTPYHRIDTQDVPPGYAEVDVLLNDNGKEFDTRMVAGQVGTQISSSEDKTLSPNGRRDTVKPVAGWWIYIIQPERKVKKKFRMVCIRLACLFKKPSSGSDI